MDAADRPHLTGLEVADYLNGGAATGPDRSAGAARAGDRADRPRGLHPRRPRHRGDLDGPQPDRARRRHDANRRQGTTVIIGDGYIGAQPDAQGRDADPLNDDQNWAFATGPVRVSRDEIFVPTLREVFDHVTNGVSFKVERNYVAYWDTALLKGVNVDRSTTP